MAAVLFVDFSVLFLFPAEALKNQTRKVECQTLSGAVNAGVGAEVLLFFCWPERDADRSAGNCIIR